MSTEIEVSKLKINVLSKDQYDSITPSNEELYFVEDSSITFVIAVSSTAPATATSGDKYCNTTNNKVYTYDGTAWGNPTDCIKNSFYADTTAQKLYVCDGTTLISVSGATGTTDYTALSNKPSINSVTLTGNKTQADLGIKTYAAFPSDFVTSGTLAEIVASIKTSSGRGKGNAYLGTISGSCMPYGSGNGECKVEYMTDNIAVLTLNSSNTPPYNWVYNTDASNLSPPDYNWKHYIPQYGTDLPTRDVPDGTVVQYTGTTTANYTKGYFYKANTTGYTCTWEQWNVQPEGLKNTATGSNSLTVGGNATNKNGSTNVGISSSITGGINSSVYGTGSTSSVNGGTAIGYQAETSGGNEPIALGHQAKAQAAGCIQIGKGTNSTAGTMNVSLSTNGSSWTNYTLLDSTGKIPADRLNTASTPTEDTTTSVQIDTVGARNTKLSNKMDTDMSNITAAGKAVISNNLMPDYSSGVTVSTATYTAPSNGFFFCYKTYTSSGANYIAVNGVQVSLFQGYDGEWSGTCCQISFPVKTGDIVSNISGVTCKFFPCAGE